MSLLSVAPSIVLQPNTDWQWTLVVGNIGMEWCVAAKVWTMRCRWVCCDCVQESKDTLKGGLDGIDHTMPFFSPAATSTVGRSGKVPPPVPPKMNSSFGADDSFSKTDVVSTPQGAAFLSCICSRLLLQSVGKETFLVLFVPWEVEVLEIGLVLCWKKRKKVLMWCRNG